MTGSFPDPAEGQSQSHEMPDAHLAWSLTTTHAQKTDGPYFGDWLPAQKAVNQPMIRQTDGATIAPSGP